LNSNVTVCAADILDKAVGGTVHLDCHEASLLLVSVVVTRLHVEVDSLNAKILAWGSPGMQFNIAEGALQIPVESTLQSNPVAVDASNTTEVPVTRESNV
jgi:hypothetical protein